MHQVRRTLIITGVVTSGLAGVVLSGITGCFDDAATKNLAHAFQSGGDRPDKPPVMLNKAVPFHYPAALSPRRIQGNVTLRLFIDRDGHVHGDSTRVVESSGYGSLDSAAVRGSQALRFVPATLRGAPVATVILFPVYFRHPAARALPGDTILRRPHASAPSAVPVKP